MKRSFASRCSSMTCRRMSRASCLPSGVVASIFLRGRILTCGLSVIPSSLRGAVIRSPGQKSVTGGRVHQRAAGLYSSRPRIFTMLADTSTMHCVPPGFVSMPIGRIQGMHGPLFPVGRWCECGSQGKKCTTNSSGDHDAHRDEVDTESLDLFPHVGILDAHPALRWRHPCKMHQYGCADRP